MSSEILASTLAVLASACKKSGSSSSSAYYIKGNMNDTAMTFNVDAAAHLTTMSGFITLAIIGSVSNPQNLQSISLNINNTPSNKPVIAGTYTESSSDFVVGAVYNPGSSSVVYGAPVNPNPTNPLTITITSIDNNTVKGTFSGDLYYTNTTTGSFGPTKKTFTNGEFYVKVQTPQRGSPTHRLQHCPACRLFSIQRLHNKDFHQSSNPIT